jgi:hypothetical protein
MPDFLPVTQPRLNEKYHVTWANSKGMVGECWQLDDRNKRCYLRSPKSGVKWKYPVPYSQLRHIRKNQNNPH